MEVEEERHPGGGLVLRHGGDDGNVDLGVSRARVGGGGVRDTLKVILRGTALLSSRLKGIA